MLNQYVNNNEIAGASLIVRKDGEIVCQTDCGYADIENKVPVTDQTMFRLASMTKPVISVAAMILVEQRKLSLTDNISDYLPSYKNMMVPDKVIGFEELYQADPENPFGPKAAAAVLKDINFIPAKNQITILDLLNHSSGMGQGAVSMGPAMSIMLPGDTLAERVEKFAGIALDFEPGTMTGYSAAVAYEVLGRIIEIVSGLDLNTFLYTYLFKPLGITDMSYSLTEEQIKRIPRIYESTEGKLIDVTDTEAGWKTVNPLVNGYYSGSAGLLGSLEEYDKFAQMLYHNGELNGVRILKEETVKQMVTESSNHHKPFFAGTVWGLGMVVFGDLSETNRYVGKGSFGWSGAYGTHFYVDPINKLTTVLMLNRSNMGGADSYISKRLEEVIYQEYCS